jgi:hypothetical protein
MIEKFWNTLLLTMKLSELVWLTYREIRIEEEQNKDSLDIWETVWWEYVGSSVVGVPLISPARTDAEGQNLVSRDWPQICCGLLWGCTFSSIFLRVAIIIVIWGLIAWG